jgi:hypothetical protein
MKSSYLRILGLSILAVGMLLAGLPLAAQNNGTPKITVDHAVAFAVSPPVRDLPDLVPTVQYGFHETEPPRHVDFHPGRGQMSGIDPVEQSYAGKPTATIVPGLSIEGINNLCSCYPPDTEAAVGDTQVVEWVNLHYAVYDKATGALLKGPLAGNTLFTSLGGACATNNDGDPIALFDKVHHRWLLTQFKYNNPAFFCVAVSTSNDATGTYYLYAFPTTDIPDYPKWGMWPTGYFATDNHFTGGFIGARLHAFNDVKMRAGDSTAEEITANLTANDYSILPADVDSPTPPPSGQVEFFIGSYDVDASNNHLYLYSMAPDFVAGTATVTGSGLANPITVPTYTPFCAGSRSCVPQLGTSVKVDAIGDRVMYRLAYWEDQPTINVLANPPKPVPSQHWFTNHTATAGSGQAGVRWYEFTAPIKKVTTLGLYQSGTFAPDSNYRWMASMARDKVGNLAVGYSISSSTMYPSINVAGRGPTDPQGQLSGETVLTAGTGSESASGSRWGDYSSMSLDPSDYCTMWYTAEYFTVPAGGAAWHTRLNQIKFDNCN